MNFRGRPIKVGDTLRSTIQGIVTITEIKPSNSSFPVYALGTGGVDSYTSTGAFYDGGPCCLFWPDEELIYPPEPTPKQSRAERFVSELKKAGLGDGYISLSGGGDAAFIGGVRLVPEKLRAIANAVDAIAIPEPVVARQWVMKRENGELWITACKYETVNDVQKITGSKAIEPYIPPEER